MNQASVQDILEVISELEEDSTVPKNVKSKLNQISQILQSDDETEIKVDKAMQEMDELGNDNNMQAYTRAQIWSIVSLLESL